MSDNLDIEALLREHLSNASEPTPHDLFDDIEAEILEKKKRKKRFFFWFWTLGIGLGLSLALLLFNFHLEDTDNLAVNSKPDTVSSMEKEELSVSIAPQEMLTTETNYSDFKKNNVDSVQNNPIKIGKLETDLGEESQLLASSETFGHSLLTESVQEPPIATSEIVKNIDFSIQENLADDKTQPRINDTITSSTTATIESDTRALTVVNHSTTLPEVENDSSLYITTTPLTKIDTTLFIADDDIDSTGISGLTDNTFTKTETSELDNTINKNDITQRDSTEFTEPAAKKYGISLFGGPTAFDIALFKPYFSSGALSSYAFKSSGFEFGVGIQRQIGQRFNLELTGAFNQKKSNFSYDLMISENDFFNSYEKDKAIPLENLDDPNSCNCFLAEDAGLEYTLNTVYLSLATSFDFVQTPKHTFGSLFELSGSFTNRYQMISSSIIAFPSNQNEQFASFRLGLGLTYKYAIQQHLLLGIRPTFYYQLNEKSTLLAAPLKELTLPVTLTLRF